MLKVGVTGGIGAGKSVVCQVFKTLGIPVFDADATARYLTENDLEIISAIKELFGEKIYRGSFLNRAEVAEQVFKQPELLKKLNSVIHPATINYGREWMAAQTSPYAIKEAAIFFETGSNNDMDVMIGVFAPEEVRIQRVLSRPGMTVEKVRERMASQIPDREKMKLCDHIITNDGKTALVPQVMVINNSLLKKV